MEMDLVRERAGKCDLGFRRIIDWIGGIRAYGFGLGGAARNK